MRAWSITGNALASAWHERRGLIKIWLPTMLILFPIEVLLHYLALKPEIYATFSPDALEITLSSPDELEEIANPINPIWASIWLIYYIVFTFFTSGLFVNSFRYLTERNFTPSWRPFDIDWKTSLAVFGYTIVILLIFAAFLVAASLIAGFIIGYGANKIVSEGITGGLDLEIRFGIATIIFGGIIGMLISLYGLMIIARINFVLVSRANDYGYKIRDIFHATKHKQPTILALVLISLTMLLPVALVALSIGVTFAALLPWMVLFFLPPWVLVVISIFLTIAVYFVVLMCFNLVCSTWSVEAYQALIGTAKLSQKSSASDELQSRPAE